MDNSKHIVKAFDKDISGVEGLLLEMGGLVETQLNDATTVLLRRDLELANEVRKKDRQINELEHEIHERAVRLLALRQPMADDLRTTVAFMKVSANLERIGDYAKNIAKRTRVLAETKPIGASENTLKRMSKMVQTMIHDALEAFVRQDLDAANDILARDQEVDLMHNTLFRELLTHMMEDPRNITPCMHLLFIAKNIERAGDHVAGIAQQIHYRVSGSLPEEKRPKGDKTSTMVVNLEDD